MIMEVIFVIFLSQGGFAKHGGRGVIAHLSCATQRAAPARFNKRTPKVQAVSLAMPLPRHCILDASKVQGNAHLH